MGKITLYRKKNSFRQQLTAFQKQCMNSLLKCLTYIRLYKVTQNWRFLILFATMFTNSIGGLRNISIVTSNLGSNHRPNYHNTALSQTFSSTFVHHVLIKKDRRVNIPSVYVFLDRVYRNENFILKTLYRSALYLNSGLSK